MNKIVIIGNGFDLAHQIPTSYNNFMDYLLNKIIIKDKSYIDGYRILGKKNKKNPKIIHLLNDDKIVDPYFVANFNYGNPLLSNNPNNKSIYIRKLILDKTLNGYWSDLEQVYFDLIYAHRHNEKNIKLINSEFEHLKILLFDYLASIEKNTGIDKKYSTNQNNQLYKILYSTSLTFSFENYYFITFNYTSKILQQYIFWMREKRISIPINPIHIHGDLKDPKNPIIFGYGDDNSGKYKDLENINNDNLLKNFKTFQYLRNSKYKELLGILEKNNNYIQVIGHSLGKTDKSLLKTIFNHPNTKYIEITYHKYEDNYFKGIYNLSRIIDNNIIMREKVIPYQDTFKIE